MSTPGLTAYGHYDQCVSTSLWNKVATTYCLVKVREVQYRTSYTIGMCLPLTCQANSFNEFLHSIQTKRFKFQVQSCRFPSVKQWSQLQWVTTGVIGTLFMFILFSTIGGFRSLESFSLIKNYQKMIMVEASDDPLECFNRFRVLSMLWIIVSNCFDYKEDILSNPREYRDWRMSWTGLVLNGGQLAVDSLFFIDACQVTINFLKTE